jgi:hypothetical protein
MTIHESCTSSRYIRRTEPRASHETKQVRKDDWLLFTTVVATCDSQRRSSAREFQNKMNIFQQNCRIDLVPLRIVLTTDSTGGSKLIWVERSPDSEPLLDQLPAHTFQSPPWLSETDQILSQRLQSKPGTARQLLILHFKFR